MTKILGKGQIGLNQNTVQVHCLVLFHLAEKIYKTKESKLLAACIDLTSAFDPISLSSCGTNYYYG